MHLPCHCQRAHTKPLPHQQQSKPNQIKATCRNTPPPPHPPLLTLCRTPASGRTGCGASRDPSGPRRTRSGRPALPSRSRETARRKPAGRSFLPPCGKTEGRTTPAPTPAVVVVVVVVVIVGSGGVMVFAQRYKKAKAGRTDIPGTLHSTSYALRILYFRRFGVGIAAGMLPECCRIAAGLRPDCCMSSRSTDRALLRNTSNYLEVQRTWY